MAYPKRTIIEYVLNRLRTVINGVAPYVNNLTDFPASRVILGSTTSIEPTPKVQIVSWGEPTEHGPIVGKSTKTLTLEIVCFSKANTPEAAMLGAADLSSDVQESLWTDRRLGGNILDMKIAVEDFDGAEWELPGYGITVMQVSLEYRK